MNYQETIDYLFKALPVFQRDGNSAFKKDLDNILVLCEALDNPHKKFKSIHVAGTNGKGSTSHILSAALQVEGYKVGLYTSPHLKDFRERIRLNGKCVSEDFVIQFVEQIKPLITKIHPSFFEITVAMAFYCFAEENVDIAVIETGLGGRLDSTNILTPILSIITNISLDHTEMLGDTLERIAVEKAGIIKKDTPLILGQVTDSCLEVFEKKCIDLHAPLIKSWLMPITIEYNPTDLIGAYQHKNINLSKIVVDELNNIGFALKTNSWREGIQNVKGLTGLRGRWDVLQEKEPRIICDTGHNKEGLEMVIESLKSETYTSLHLVIGVVKEKDLDLLNILPKNSTYYFCKPDVLRGLDEGILKEEAGKRGLIGESYESVNTALKKAKSDAKRKDLIFVGGSTFVVAEVV
jgi:dihydrofolate synthase/folylpolyglutamate synthase